MAFNMASKEKPNDGPTKSFMTVGPTLHYSHLHVYRHWWMTLIVYTAVCIFWSKILTGAISSLQLTSVNIANVFSLGNFVIAPISIYEYPWHILILGGLMGILAVVPLLMSQLLSSRYSVIFILLAALIAKLPGLAICLVIASVAIATRPLRFRSRFISLVLCTAPLVVYWAVFGGIRSVDPVRWGFSFAPWLIAWITSLVIAGTVLGIGHFNRYRPGLTWLIALILFITITCVFHKTISFAESDYQIYVKQRSPLEAEEFQSKSITPILDKVVQDPILKSYLNASFYSNEPILLRAELKREMQEMLKWNHWPEWFSDFLPETFIYEKKRKSLLDSYQYFISNHPGSKRMPIALYFKGITSELSPDIRSIGSKELLRFYLDYPKKEVLPVWIKLYTDFPDSPESIEARWRIAHNMATKRDFRKAINIGNEALIKLNAKQDFFAEPEKNIKTIFIKPQTTVINNLEAEKLDFKIRHLLKLIDGENHNDTPDSHKRLAAFLGLNPYDFNYENELNRLIEKCDPQDPLFDNLLLAKAKLTEDHYARINHLQNIVDKFEGRDAAIQAIYEIGLLKIQIWRKMDSTNQQNRENLLNEARQKFETLIQNYPQSIFNKKAANILQGLSEYI